jgi:hypothetical protein
VSTRLTRKTLVAAVAGIGLVTAVFLSCIEVAPKSAVTLTAISRLGIDVHSFYETNHHLPTNLEELKPDPRFRNDAWGRPITYTITSSNSYVLRSLGPDGKRGKENMAYTFDAADLSGTPVQ